MEKWETGSRNWKLLPSIMTRSTRGMSVPFGARVTSLATRMRSRSQVFARDEDRHSLAGFALEAEDQDSFRLPLSARRSCNCRSSEHAAVDHDGARDVYGNRVNPFGQGSEVAERASLDLQRRPRRRLQRFVVS